MLTLHLSMRGNNVYVAVSGEESHTFPVADIAIGADRAREFFQNPCPYGQRLHNALFPAGSAAAEALRALPPAPHSEGILALHLETPDLYGPPWEYLHDGRRFLATDYAFVRLVSPEFPVGGGDDGPERRALFFVPADPLLQPDGTPSPHYLGVDTEWDDLRKILEETDPPLDVHRIVPPTVQRLNNALVGVRGAILHFTGHGTADGRNAYLLFEQPSGAADPAEPSRLAPAWRGAIWLAVLSACRSGMPGESLEANLAALLCAQSIPFALGMQLSVPDVTARRFTDGFYRALFRGATVPEAARQGRLTVLNDPGFPSELRHLLLGIPVLYAAAPLRPARMSPGQGVRMPPDERARLDLAGLPVPQTGFFGRQRELVRIGELLTRERPRQGEIYPPLTVTLHGTGGIGKTALLRRAAERFAWNFERVIALSLEPLPSPADVLDRLERALGLPPAPEQQEEERFQRLTDALRDRRILLALDNVESLIYARDGADEAQRRASRAIYRFLSDLPVRGVALMASSRECTGLPGEQQVSISGLEEAAGAELFRSRISRRKGDLTPEGLQTLSHRVGGHPLALRLLASRFDEGAESLATFTERLEELLPAAADLWDDESRHATLEACFQFSLQPLERNAPELVEALARLSLFSGPFVDFTAAPVLFSAFRDADEDAQQKIQQKTADILHRLWGRGLLEREEVPLDSAGILCLYSLHPALRPFAARRLPENARAEAEAGFFSAMRALGSRAYTEFEKGGMVSLLARRCIGDLVRAAEMHADREGSVLRFHTGGLLRVFGDLEGAMRLYQQAREILESLGDLRGKSATLHEMAGILALRGDLEGAMRLYQQSLQIKESLGDLRGKAVTLAMMGQALAALGRLEEGERALQEALEILERIGARPDAETVREILETLRRLRAGGGELVPSPSPTPPPRAPVPEGAQALTPEEWVQRSVGAARQGGAEARAYRRLASRIAAAAETPEELRALAGVLLNILMGDFHPDLSGLPPELAELVRRNLETSTQG